MMVSRYDKSVRPWISQFYANGGELPENKQGKYQRTGILWSSEDLDRKAVKYMSKIIVM